jgi:hypothetical protein
MASRRQTDKTAEASFQDRLLKRLDDCEERLDVKDKRIDELEAEIETLKKGKS